MLMYYALNVWVRNTPLKTVKTQKEQINWYQFYYRSSGPRENDTDLIIKQITSTNFLLETLVEILFLNPPILWE